VATIGILSNKLNVALGKPCFNESKLFKIKVYSKVSKYYKRIILKVLKSNCSMTKFTIKRILLLLFIMLSTKAIAQVLPIDKFADLMLKDSLRAILYRVEVSELTKKREYPAHGWDLGEQFFFAGDLFHAVVQLTNSSVARVKISGVMPDKHISFWGERFNSDMDGKGRKVVKPKKLNNTKSESLIESINNITKRQNQEDFANIMIINALQKTYAFSVTDIEDSCEVWVVKVSDSDKLSSFLNLFPQDMHHGSGSTTKSDKCYFDINSFELLSIWEYLELRSKHIIYDNTNDPRRFSMSIPCDDFNDFDKTNQALAPFGLVLIKEKRLEKLKLMTFFE
jgi:hypothetical protein